MADERIPRVAIVGAGFVGSTTAYALTLSGMAAEVVLIDRNMRRAEGHVNDLLMRPYSPIQLAFLPVIFRTAAGRT
jgi:malate/lactate dehydrogenase